MAERNNKADGGPFIGAESRHDILGKIARAHLSGGGEEFSLNSKDDEKDDHDKTHKDFKDKEGKENKESKESKNENKEYKENTKDTKEGGKDTEIRPLERTTGAIPAAIPPNEGEPALLDRSVII